MVDRSLSLHLCRLHQNPLSSDNTEDTEQPAKHWEMDATIFTKNCEGGGENSTLPAGLGQGKADIQSGRGGEASELHDLIHMSVPLPGVL